MSAARRALGLVFGAAATAGIVALSRVPYAASRGEDGELRLAWRWRSERVELCRKVSAEDLAKLPVHMRRAELCERRLQPYLLEVAVDGRAVVRDSVRATGAQSDRPLSVFRRIALAPGRHSARIVFSPLGSFALEVGEHREARAARTLVLDTTITVSPRQVVLLTMDEDRGVLVVRTVGQ